MAEIIGMESQNRDVTAIYNNIKGRGNRSFYLTTHLSGLFQFDVLVCHSILFFYGHRQKQNRVGNKIINMEESTWMGSK